MDHIEQLNHLGDEKENLMLKDFVNKRSAHFNAVARKLSDHCLTKCEEYAYKLPKLDINDPD